MKLIYTAKMSNYESDDGGTVLTAESSPIEEGDGGTWVRLLSHDDDEVHETFRKLEGKTVTITIEEDYFADK